MNEPTTKAYVERWFVPIEQLAGLSGSSLDETVALVAAGAAPGPVYVRSEDEWWNALDDHPAPSNGECWYAPAAAYWLRRARIVLRSGETVQAAARTNRDHFVDQFCEAIGREPLAAVAFADAFTDSGVDIEAAAKRALTEWEDWTNAGYAVCLRSFTGQTCVEKESLAHFLRRCDPDGTNDLQLLDLVERLNALMLPFAPFQRAGCTPGFAVDRLLSAMALGKEDPYHGLT